MKRLILLGGPPGVGKSTLITHLRRCQITCIEADEESPPNSEADPNTAIDIVGNALEHALLTSETVFLSWVFARDALYQPFLDRFCHCDIHQIYLVCSPHDLQNRLKRRGDEALLSYAAEKLELINRLPFDKIDSTDQDSSIVSQSLMARFNLSS